jgi:hypothetical protein
LKLECPSCHATIGGADVDLGRGIGVCRACGEIAPLPAPGALAPVADAAERYRPAELRWVESNASASTRIAVRRARSQALLTIPFLVFWFGFLAFWYAMAIQTGNFVAMIFPLLHVAAGVFLAWSTARLFNTVVVTMSPAALDIHEGPVPVPRARMTFAVDRIRGFSAASESGRRSRSVHRVSVLLHDGIAMKLPLRFDDGTHAIFASARLNELLEEVRLRRLDAQTAAYRD